MKLPEGLPIPDGLEKSEIIDLLLREEYGYLPPPAYSVSGEIMHTDDVFCAGKAILKKIKLKCKADFGEFSFPVYYTRPLNKREPIPCFIHINFRDCVPDKYQPSEEIADEGFAVLSFCYKDVTSDDGDFSDGLAGIVYPEGRTDAHSCGKIGLWAWAAMRVMDYAQSLSELDKAHISVAGHSRLGKTALLAGALDERFYCAFSNCSGCSGAAISRSKGGEDIAAICERFPYWFCENYKKYAKNESALPFDQHYLIAANYPHRVYVASAVEDTWACPENEQLSCFAASSYYEKRGLTGFVCGNDKAEVGDFFGDGYIGYHLRANKHYFSRDDWKRYIEYLSLHK